LKKKRFLLLVFFSLLLTTSLGAAFYFIFLRGGGGASMPGTPAASLKQSEQQPQPGSMARLPAAAELHSPPLPDDDLPEAAAAIVNQVTGNSPRSPASESTAVSPMREEYSSGADHRPDEQPDGYFPDRRPQDKPDTTNGSNDRSPGAADSSVGRTGAEFKSYPESNLPRVAIVIDDMGYERQAGERLLALDLDLTFSFLPHAPHTRNLSRLAREIGRDVLLHLPMEPIDTARWDPGPGALYLSMPIEDLRRNLQDNLAAVPMAIGVNNHMGSRFTANPQAMATVMSILRPQDLFFLDSLTTADSTGYHVAREFGMRAIRRDIFLDNDRAVELIERQIAALIRLAGKQGSAVAIAHPHAGTVAALMSSQEQLRTVVEVVGIQNLVQGSRQ
jgi:uncharacterized protein